MTVRIETTKAEPLQAAALCAALRGQEMRLPDLQAMFEHWDHGVNPNYERLLDDVESMLSE